MSRTTSPSWRKATPGRVRRDRHRVAGQQVLALAQPDDQRAAEPGADHLAGTPRADHAQAVGPLQVRQARCTASNRSSVDSSSRAIRWAITSVSVWLAKSNPCGLELAPERRVVLDHAVVHDGDRRRPAAAAQVGMRVAVVGRPVRRPSRVADPAPARRRLGLEQLFQGAHAARPPDVTRADRARWSPARRCHSRGTPAGAVRRPGSAPPDVPRCSRRSRTWLASFSRPSAALAALGKIDETGQRKPGMRSSGRSDVFSATRCIGSVSIGERIDRSPTATATRLDYRSRSRPAPTAEMALTGPRDSAIVSPGQDGPGTGSIGPIRGDGGLPAAPSDATERPQGRGPGVWMSPSRLAA